MTDDILTQLRNALEFYKGWWYLQCSTADLKRAADEIERLRKMAYAMIDELRQNGGYEPYTTQMLFNEFYEQAVRGE